MDLLSLSLILFGCLVLVLLILIIRIFYKRKRNKLIMEHDPNKKNIFESANESINKYKNAKEKIEDLYE